jgi:hypothetical protein
MGDDEHDAVLETRTLNDMVKYHAPQLPLMRDEDLVSLYNTVHNLPRTSTRNVVESVCGVRLNGLFPSGIPSRYLAIMMLLVICTIDVSIASL